MRVLGSAAFLFVSALAACGGGTAYYDDDASLETCIEGKGARVMLDTDPLVSGSRGNLDADFKTYDVFIAFGKDSHEAFLLARDVKVTGSAFGGIDVRDFTKTKGNVVYYANAGHESDNGMEAVESCLK